MKHTSKDPGSVENELLNVDWPLGWREFELSVGGEMGFLRREKEKGHCKVNVQCNAP